MRPRSILLFERLYILKIVIGAIAGMFVLSSLSVLVAPEGAPPAVQRWMPFFIGGSLLIGVLISVLLLYFIARRGSEVAKWIFIVLFALGAIGLIHSFTGGRGLALHWTRGLSAVQVVIEIGMLWLLFQPDAKQWFARRGRRSMDYSDDYR